MKSNTSKCIGSISSKIIKEIISEIPEPLSIIFNLSLENGKFPKKLKIAKIVPILKSEDQLIVNSYWTISVLPLFLQNTCKVEVL